MGRNNDPITLHKYLYANADPANGIDPSGHSGLFSFSTAMNISARLATTAIANYPRATLLVQIAAQVATPLELAALSPVSAGLVGGGTVGLAALRHLDKAENLAKSSFWLNRIGSGNEFEKFVAKLIGQKVNTQAILNGGSAAGRPAGSAIPDFFFRGGILEAKLTGAAVTKNQLQQYARYVGDGGNITYMFKQKPTPSQISTMERWLKESKFDAVLQVAYVFE